MKQEKHANRFWFPGAVVGTVHTLEGITEAARIAESDVDAVEIRLDHLPISISASAFFDIACPKILTPRIQAEGGARDWTEKERLQMTEPLLEVAAGVDLELLHLEHIRSLQDLCKERRISQIISFHDFSGTPPIETLRRYKDQAIAEGATIFKVATTLRTARDILPLLFLLEESEIPIAAMGMGEMGRAARLYLAAAGSVLNYGWLHRPQVSGQYPAELLRKRIQEVQRTGTHQNEE